MSYNNNNGYMPPNGYRPPPQSAQQYNGNPNVNPNQNQPQNHNHNHNHGHNYNHNHNQPPAQYQNRRPPQMYAYQNQQAQYWNRSLHSPIAPPNHHPIPPPSPHSNPHSNPHPNPQSNAHPHPNLNASLYGMNGYSNGVPSTYQIPSLAPVHQPQQYQQPQPSQFISPTQIFHQVPPTQPLPAQSYQRTTSESHVQNIVSPAFVNPSSMGSRASSTSEPDLPSLLIALAEEYFSTAHQLAPSISGSMNEAETEAYASLISTGLGCLSTAIERLKMSPRLEAQVRLRYAGVLFQETDNHMNAEMTLSQGIALCVMNHYDDLKYAMQFLLAQVLAKNNIKASLKALDSHATEAQTLQHFSWVYAFRFLRATYSLDSGGHVDIHAAVQNLRGIAAVATQQQDYTIHMAASLLEAMAYMKSTAPDAVQNVQAALAKAWSNQTNVRNTTQLIGLAHFTQVACSIRHGDPKDMQQKLQEMQTMMDATIIEHTWSGSGDTIAIPINRTASSSQTVSSDTRMVLGIGEDGRDNLMLSFLSQKDAYSINYLFCGIIYLRRSPQDRKAMEFFEEGIQALRGDTQTSKGSVGLLPDLLERTQWRGRVTCYLRIYLAFQMAIVGDWKAIKIQLQKLKRSASDFNITEESDSGLLGLLSLYLQGICLQGTGKFDAALETYENQKFSLSGSRSSNLTLPESMEREICILAALNRISILQVDGRRNSNTNVDLIQALEPYCVSHLSQEIRTAYHLILATVRTNPEAQLFETKKNLRLALQGSQATGNQLFTCITLNVMCSKFFTGVVGPQAEKSAQAAAVTASKTGNALWRSVAEGALGRCYEVQGKTGEGVERLRYARNCAQKAFSDV